MKKSNGHSGQPMTIAERWKRGAKVNERCAARFYGERAFRLLAEKGFKGVRSANEVYHEHRLAERWPYVRALRADKTKLPWFLVQALLTLEPNRREATRARSNPELRRRIEARKEQAEAFFCKFESDDLRGEELEEVIIDWKRGHPECFTQGKRRSMAVRRNWAIRDQLFRLKYVIQRHIKHQGAELHGAKLEAFNALLYAMERARRALRAG